MDLMDSQASAIAMRQKLFIIAVSVYVGMMTLAGMADLSITNAVANPASIFGTIFQNFGLFAPAVVCLIASQIIARAAWQSNRILPEKLLMIGGAVIFSFWQLWQYIKIVLYYYLASSNNLAKHQPIGMFNRSIGGAHLSFWATFGIVLLVYTAGTYLSQQWLQNKSTGEMEYLVKVAIVAILIVLISSSVNGEMKQTWGRVRPYELNATQSNYTPWYQINGQNGHMSFPSGHSTSAAMAVLFGLFVSRKNIQLQRYFFIGGIVYAFMMATSRVRIGAHFMGDTVTGVFGSFLIVFIILLISRIHIVETPTNQQA